MAITRTQWQDDDGTGTTGTVINNAEKQLLYDQIDAALGTLPPSYLAGVWTPIDSSGAGLVFTGAARYIRIGSLVTIQAYVTFPATASSAPAVIGGLPVPCHGVVYGGLYQTYGIQNVLYIDPGATAIRLYNQSSLVVRTNADMSGAQMGIAGIYHTT